MAPDAHGADIGPLVVVLIGAESTGKSTLAARLAQRFNAPLSLEFARQYLEHHQSTLTGHDVDPIARGQMGFEDRAHAVAVAAGLSMVIKDTDLISTVVYARQYHGHCPHWVVHAAKARRGDLYLRLAPDVPWVADGLQRDAAHTRGSLHTQFGEALVEFEAFTHGIVGSWAEREAAAVAAIDARLTTRARGGAVRPRLHP